MLGVKPCQLLGLVPVWGDIGEAPWRILPLDTASLADQPVNAGDCLAGAAVTD